VVQQGDPVGGAAKDLGRGGERAALLLLRIKGYRLLHRNWRGPSGELDLVFERKRVIVFVEVKTRSGTLFGGALGAVGPAKTVAMVRTAASYLGRYGLWHRPCRFDVVAIEGISRPPFWRIIHIEDAFRPDLGRRM
jgi:putative endonuclease